MNKLNDKGQRHGYWVTDYDKINYHNDIFHGKYESFTNKSKTLLHYKGCFDMGKRTGLWIQYNYSNQLKLKVFYL